MTFSAARGSRKWAFAGTRGGAALALALALISAAGPIKAATVPMPQPRPEQAPQAEKTPPGATPDAAPKPEEPPPVSPCRVALTEAIAIAPSLSPISGPGACGAEDLVRLEAVVLPDGGRVAMKPAATMRCAMAASVADWVRTDLATLAQGLGSKLAELDNFDSYDCRGRNRVAGARMSEHGRANALDVRGFKLTSGRMISFTERGEGREVREAVLQSVCARFTTVLGPGSDWYHEDHIHLDLAERRSGYRICQWNVYEPLPQVAPLLPAGRPEEAPPREVVSKAREKPGEAPAIAAPQNNAAPVAPPTPPEPQSKRGRSKQSIIR